MFFMVSYNLDAFRAFLFESRFFQRFRLPDKLRGRLEKDDMTLMTFGFDWLKFSLFGLPTLQPNSSPYPAAGRLPM